MIASIVITYNPDRGIQRRIDNIALQSDLVVVVDNGSANLILKNEKNIIIVKNEKNIGVAAAINRGIGFALSWGANYVCLFDQDSEIEDFFIAKLLGGFKQGKNVGIIAANYISPVSGRIGYSSIPQDSREYFEIAHAITSGSMLKMEIFSIVGLMREDLFIDYVDIEFCERLDLAGFKILATSKPLMEHPIGNAKNHEIFGKIRITSSNHSPVRRYYMIRNCVRLAIENFSINWNFSRVSLQRVLKIVVITLAFEDNKFIKTRYMLKGLLDGMRGNMGEVN